jgi:hypothetical protein
MDLPAMPVGKSHSGDQDRRKLKCEEMILNTTFKLAVTVILISSIPLVAQMTVKNSNANITPPGEPDMAK